MPMSISGPLNLYDTLIFPSDDGKGLKPGLATDWRISRRLDRAATHTARRGIKFPPTARQSRRPM